ncbi:MAG: short chain dehydrogenase, partial [Longimicrobiales bacterium]|nr:short chain dehydrogenase [Longimicrobiales bacterium]
MKVLVVGATGTIGSAVVSALEERGHEVLEASRNAEYSVDIRDPDSIRSLYDEIGTVDGVICCAGNAAFEPLLELEDEDIERSLEDKLMGQVNLVRFGADHVSDGGTFILTAGIFSQDPPPGVPAIAMVNGAVESFARAAALDLPRDIRINTISPPFITETAREMGMSTEGTLSAAANAKV